ncbi:flagellar FliJ family protein [Helicobacter heilmannii]|uniref:flagellar FliJ family protein n=1 Tax=Helicobacter heilmannii TaxID=35817 RepID=UPI000CF0E784|nr:flagellar FliJ family protein [Helicobacter heilmannii]
MNLKTFKALVHVKKQAMQRCEADIAANLAKIHAKQEEQQGLVAELNTLSVPTTANMAAFIQCNSLKKNYLYAIDQVGLEISELKSIDTHLRELYKNVCIEYEKLQYLYTLELKKRAQKLEKEEAKQMDSIGAEVFYRKQKARRA